MIGHERSRHPSRTQVGEYGGPSTMPATRYCWLKSSNTYVGIGHSLGTFLLDGSPFRYRLKVVLVGTLLVERSHGLVADLVEV